MSIEKVRAYFKPLGIEDRIREFDVSSATVELAAVAVGVDSSIRYSSSSRGSSPPSQSSRSVSGRSSNCLARRVS